MSGNRVFLYKGISPLRTTFNNYKVKLSSTRYLYKFIFAGEQGFEPRSATLKAAVLPLNHSPEQSSLPCWFQLISVDRSYEKCRCRVVVDSNGLGRVVYLHGYHKLYLVNLIIVGRRVTIHPVATDFYQWISAMNRK